MTPHPQAPRRGDPSPWGRIDFVHVLGPHAVSVSTPGHGGIWISAEAFDRLPLWGQKTFAGGRWYEEDCDWAIPYVALRLDRYDDPPVIVSARFCIDHWHKPHTAAELDGYAVDVEAQPA